MSFYVLNSLFWVVVFSYSWNMDPVKYHHLHVQHKHTHTLHDSFLYIVCWLLRILMEPLARGGGKQVCFYSCCIERSTTHLIYFSPSYCELNGSSNNKINAWKTKTYTAADFQNNNEQIGVTNTNAQKKSRTVFRFCPCKCANRLVTIIVAGLLAGWLAR